MFLCVMRNEVEVSAAVAAVAADPENGIEAADEVAAIMEVRPLKCYVEMSLARVKEVLADPAQLYEFYQINFGDDDEPLLSKVSITGTAPKMVEAPVLQNDQGDMLG